MEIFAGILLLMVLFAHTTYLSYLFILFIKQLNQWFGIKNKEEI